MEGAHDVTHMCIDKVLYDRKPGYSTKTADELAYFTL